jgi:lipopolysaccharide/colanic/teichoic acid biosynthesis glycosyltransferase
MLVESLLPAPPTAVDHDHRGRSIDRTVLPLPVVRPDARLVSASRYLAFKPMAEFLFALILLILAAPVIVLTAVLVRLTSRGAAFYSQVRLGKNSRPFLIYKIRTMRQDAERQSGACWSTKGDPRVTALGRILRKTHLDELPQLWNVLRGDMSLVGPRPERPEFVPTLEKAIPGYRDRLLVKPGVTGLAQVRLDADTDLESVRRKLKYDIYYVRHLNLWMDLRLIVCTAFHMAGVRYSVLGKVFVLPQLHREAPSAPSPSVNASLPVTQTT